MRKHQARRQAIEWSKRFPLQPPLIDERSHTLGAFLITILSDPQIHGTARFGVFLPEGISATDVALDTQVFSRLLKGAWSVSVDRNIDGKGSRGWMFVREP